MAQEVVWTVTARKSLKQIIDWLLENYGEEYAERSLRWILAITNEVAKHPTKGMVINSKRSIRGWRVDSHNYITYAITDNGIVIKNILAYKRDQKGF